jgi:FkbM family methyltransferase
MMINFLDLGSHDGREIDNFIKIAEELGLSYTISSFEANKDSYNYLVNKYKGNSKVVVYHNAISDKEVQVKLYLSSNTQSHSIYSTKNNVTKDYEEVQAVTISSYLKEDAFNILRFNIEGAELPMIKELISSGKYSMVSLFLGAEVGADIKKCSEIAGEYNNYLKLLKDNGIVIHQWCADTPFSNTNLKGELKRLIYEKK